MFFAKQRQQLSLSKSINRQMLLVLGGLVVVFIIAQFAILATLGTKGGEIAGIRMEMNDLRIQNESLRADIDEAKTVENIQNNITQVMDLYPVGVEKITVSEPNAVSMER